MSGKDLRIIDFIIKYVGRRWDMGNLAAGLLIWPQGWPYIQKMPPRWSIYPIKHYDRFGQQTTGSVFSPYSVFHPRQTVKTGVSVALTNCKLQCVSKLCSECAQIRMSVFRCPTESKYSSAWGNLKLMPPSNPSTLQSSKNYINNEIMENEEIILAKQKVARNYDLNRNGACVQHIHCL